MKQSDINSMNKEEFIKEFLYEIKEKQIPEFNNGKCKISCNCIEIAEAENGGNPVKSYACLGFDNNNDHENILIMADKIKYNGTGDGYSDKGVHFIDGVKDYTLCGLTLDGDEDTAGGFDATKEKVDCEECIRIVKYCKGIRNNEMNQT